MDRVSGGHDCEGWILPAMVAAHKPTLNIYLWLLACHCGNDSDAVLLTHHGDEDGIVISSQGRPLHPPGFKAESDCDHCKNGHGDC